MLPPRWLICYLLLAISTHAFISRLMMSVSVQRIQVEFGLTNLEVGSILSAFILGYGVVQLPVGILTDRIGAHRLLAVTLAGWSGFHLLTGLARGAIVAPLMTIRFLMGVAQAALLPCAFKTNSRWMPLEERALANAVVLIGLGIGGALGPPLTVALTSWGGWRLPFFVLGAAGIALGGLWWRVGADAPTAAQAPAAPRPAPARKPTPWQALRASRSVLCLALSYGVSGYPSYVFFTWFFLYLVNVRGVDLRAGGYWSALPFIAIATMTPLGGKLSDLLTARYGKRRGRLSVVLAGTLTAALLIAIGARVQDTRLAVVLLSLGAGFHLFGQAPSWAATIDIAPEHSATVFGIMNTLGQFSGACAPVLTPIVAARFGWTSALDFAALMAAGAGVLWLGVRPEKQLPS